MEFSWSFGDSMVVGPSVKRSTNEPFFHLTLLQPNFNYDDEFIRKLIHESHSIFKKLRVKGSTTNLSSNELTEISLQYRYCVRSICIGLKQNAESSKNFNLLNTFKNVELIWSLVDFLLLRTADGLPSSDLVEWAKWNFSEPSDVEEEILASSVLRHTPDNHPNYWDTVFTYILLGRGEEARQFLLRHSQKSLPVFVSVDELLRKIPDLTVTSDKNNWFVWQNECRRRVDDGMFAAYPELELIVRVLSGENQVFNEFSRLRLTWYQIIVGKIFFCYPLSKIYELPDLAADCFKNYSTDDQVGVIDEILIAVFELDLIRMLKLSSSFFDNWWFVAHLADLLHYGGSMDLGSVKETIDLREYLLLEYANSLMTHKSLWQLSVDYYLACPTFGKFALKLNLEKISPSSNSDRKTLKILEICRLNEFHDVAKSITKEQCLKAFKCNDLNKALSWCLQTKDSVLTGYLAQQFLRLHGRSGLIHTLYLLDNLGSAGLLSPSLTFIGKYREFCKLRESEEFQQACSLLVHLILSRVSPRQFWLILLEDLLPFMQNCKEKSLINAAELYSLMNFVEDIENEMEVMKNSNFYVDRTKDDEIFKKLLPDLRLFLAKNLGRTVVSSRS